MIRNYFNGGIPLYFMDDYFYMDETFENSVLSKIDAKGIDANFNAARDCFIESQHCSLMTR